MKIAINAIGKLKKNSPEYQIFHEYIKRTNWKIECNEFNIKNSGGKQKDKENEVLVNACSGYEYIVALDESGKLLSSQQFATNISDIQQRGISSVAFIIGGADGLTEETLGKVNLIWSFGRVTWPHMLVRALLAEQIYRCYCLISNHPYHRE
ncbi:MAG: 23S rRNA (pseudouridine(1915)-N(3))-methyltransferase RlmH [Rickettsiales bacterium]